VNWRRSKNQLTYVCSSNEVAQVDKEQLRSDNAVTTGTDAVTTGTDVASRCAGILLHTFFSAAWRAAAKSVEKILAIHCL
jgi:hypothetical protein